MDLIKEKKRFSIIARIKSATHAWRGIGILIRTTHNFWLQIFFGLLAVYLGFVFSISQTEWLFVIFSIGLVVISEALNTAFEIDIDLTPNYHPYARDTKDVAAAAVLMSVMLSIIIGGIICIPKILLII